MNKIKGVAFSSLLRRTTHLPAYGCSVLRAVAVGPGEVRVQRGEEIRALDHVEQPHRDWKGGKGGRERFYKTEDFRY